MNGRRTLVLLLALLGAGVASYLACVQLDVFHSAWDPVFGGASSDRVLHSSFAEALPFPDALAGAVGYFAEVALGVVIGRSNRRWWSIAYGFIVVAMAAAGIVLTALQAVVVHHYCLLCITSAAVSWAVAAVAAPDLHAIIRRVASTNVPQPFAPSWTGHRGGV